MDGLREATIEDASLIAWQRRAMFQEAILPKPATLDEMEQAFVPWVRDRLASGTYFGWLVESEPGHVIAGAGLWVTDFPPHFLHPSTGRGYLLNFYVAPEHRGQGLARQLLATAVARAKAMDLRIVTLHASRFGRPLYSQHGFRDNNEMILLTDGSLDSTM